MQRPDIRKFIISGIALSLLFGGGVIYSGGKDVRAITREDQPPASIQGHAIVQKHNKRKEHKSHTGTVKHPHGALHQDVADILKLDREELRAKLADGASIVEVARERGVSEADLTTRLIESKAKVLEEAVAAGRLTQDKANQITEHMQEHLKELLNRNGLKETRSAPGGRDKDEGMKHKSKALRHNAEKMAELIGIDKDEMVNRLKQGESLAEIAESKGMSKKELVGKIQERMAPWIERMVEHKAGADDLKK